MQATTKAMPPSTMPTHAPVERLLLLLAVLVLPVPDLVLETSAVAKTAVARCELDIENQRLVAIDTIIYYHTHAHSHAHTRTQCG